MPLFIPTELVAHIATFLDRRTLLSFRSASKQYQQASEHSFLETHFSTRTHLYTSESLGRLLDICQSPHLTKCLRAIEILQPDSGVWVENPYVDWYGPPGNIDWEAWIQDSQGVKEDDITLRELLRCLKRNNITPKISVRSSAKPCEDRPYGFQEYMKPWKQSDRHEIGEDTMLHRRDLCDLASYRLVTAAADSAFRLKSLTLQDVCEPAVPYSNAGDDIQRFDTFFRALGNITSLESISLLFSKDPSRGHDEEPLSAIVKALEPLPLSTIELRHVSGSPETFVALLAQHESTLRQVSWEDVGIVDADPMWTWELPVLRMCSMAQLQRVSLKYLCGTADERTISRLQEFDGRTSWIFEEGKDTVARGITGLIGRVNFYDIHFVGEPRD